MKKIKVPTGHIIIDEYEKGRLETLSIGDYGKDKNVKADFLGYTRPLYGVPNGNCLPLSQKWVVTLSTQYGCSMKCVFCDVPKVKYAGNASQEDLKNQLINAIIVYPHIRYTDRLNIHFARMGEPSFAFNAVYSFSEWLKKNGKIYLRDTFNLSVEVIHPVFTTALPKSNKKMDTYLHSWCTLKNDQYDGQAGLQLSINSTNDLQRNEMFNNLSYNLSDISNMCATLPKPIGRKYCLNFAYASNFEIDAAKLKLLFDPSKFMVKITPIHNNMACKQNNIKTIDGYHSYDPYEEVENSLKNVGFDVLIFVPSFDEEHGMITCGNAVLGTGRPKLAHTIADREDVAKRDAARVLHDKTGHHAVRCVRRGTHGVFGSSASE